MSKRPEIARAREFCGAYGLRVPILLAPMAGSCPPALSIAVAGAGGLGACGAIFLTPEAIKLWAFQARAGGNGAFQMNLWTPDPPPARDPAGEAASRAFLSAWGPPVPPEAGDVTPPDFAAQCEAILDAGPPIISSIMGLYPPAFVSRMKARGIKWFANVTTVTEAVAAQNAGADAVVAQGMEAGGHRGAFNAAEAEAGLIGLFSLLPAVADAVTIPVIAAGGIADARGIAAAFLLGASAVQIGTGFLRCPEAGLHPVWADAIGQALPEHTIATRAFSGRLGRGIATAYVRAAMAPDAPKPAPFPVQRGLTQAMRDAAVKAANLDGMQAWAGQSARLAQARPAGELVTGLWQAAEAMLR